MLRTEYRSCGKKKPKNREKDLHSCMQVSSVLSGSEVKSPGCLLLLQTAVSSLYIPSHNCPLYAAVPGNWGYGKWVRGCYCSLLPLSQICGSSAIKEKPVCSHQGIRLWGSAQFWVSYLVLQALSYASLCSSRSLLPKTLFLSSGLWNYRGLCNSSSLPHRAQEACALCTERVTTGSFAKGPRFFSEIVVYVPCDWTELNLN